MTIHLINKCKIRLIVLGIFFITGLFSPVVFAEQYQAPQQSEAKPESSERKVFSFLSEERKNVPASTTDALGVSLGLIFILLLIFSMAWFMKKMGYSNLTGQGQLKILATLNLGQKEKIALIQVGKQQLLVGMTATQINTLHVLDEPIDETDIGASTKSKTPVSHPFADKLSALLSKKNN